MSNPDSVHGSDNEVDLGDRGRAASARPEIIHGQRMTMLVAPRGRISSAWNAPHAVTPVSALERDTTGAVLHDRTGTGGSLQWDDWNTLTSCHPVAKGRGQVIPSVIAPAGNHAVGIRPRYEGIAAGLGCLGEHVDSYVSIVKLTHGNRYQVGERSSLTVVMIGVHSLAMGLLGVSSILTCVEGQGKPTYRLRTASARNEA